MPRLIRWIWIVCASHFAIGMVAYAHFLATGSYSILTWYFWIPGTVFFLVATLAETFLAFQCSAGFERDEPMHLAWMLITFAALSRFAGAALIATNRWHLTWITGISSQAAALVSLQGLARVGAVVGGPVSMIFLAAGLARVLQVQRKFGILGGLTGVDRLLIAMILAFTLSQIAIFVPLAFTHPPVSTVILWLSDPLLSVLLIEAVLVRRSMLRVGHGLIAQCWGMYVTAIIATSAGDAAIWAEGRQILSAPLTALSWYIWFLAAAAFACAPAYQFAAVSLPLASTGNANERAGVAPPAI